MAKLKSAHWVLVEHVPQGGLGVDEVVFDVETVDAVLHALEAGDVIFVVANDEGLPLSKGGLFFGVNLDVLRRRHGIFPLVGRFIILPYAVRLLAPSERRHTVKWQGS